VSNQMPPTVVQMNVTYSTRFPRPALRTIAVLLLSLTLATACQPPRTSWKDIAPAPSAASYEGQAEKLLDQRLASRVTERNLKVLDSRLEQLPLDVTWCCLPTASPSPTRP
jgi:hypothetical protein